MALFSNQSAFKQFKKRYPSYVKSLVLDGLRKKEYGWLNVCQKTIKRAFFLFTE